MVLFKDSIPSTMIFFFHKNTNYVDTFSSYLIHFIFNTVTDTFLIKVFNKLSFVDKAGDIIGSLVIDKIQNTELMDTLDNMFLQILYY